MGRMIFGKSASNDESNEPNNTNESASSIKHTRSITSTFATSDTFAATDNFPKSTNFSKSSNLDAHKRSIQSNLNSQNSTRLAKNDLSNSKKATTSSSLENQSSKNAFVDARRLSVVDFVKQTLKSSSGPLGITSRPKVIDFSAREKEKNFAKIRTFLLRFAYTFLAVALIALLCWMLFLSPFFRLDSKNIRIFGSNEWVSEQKIELIASNQVDKSLFLVSSQQIIEQLNNIPGVTETKVVKQFPHGLQITVRAQKPAAMLKAKDGEKLTAVDVKGRVLNAVQNVSTSGIPVIEVSDVSKSLNSRAVKEALKIVSSLSQDFRSHVIRVSAKTQDSVETEVSYPGPSGEVHRIVVWGDSSDLELKKAIVETIISDPSKIGNRQLLDVSAPARPILK
ncbi:cell division protein FtsQ/DivIB [Gardnerella piotii]|uniref:cell division protein FtsQ/DivIB n=1 Tax=Gardnerella pickettii TaxID=2914924 RepID=UPI0002635806|nr:FtsQ-type POTRA domain-containing protein [Gardnerella pickettii]EIK86041.1 cell division protein [Gardnerella pickettii 00703C2mash]MDK7188514.1 FtsQ-type POTRA domain-containing protein [Bifidobacterium sp. UMB1230]